MTTDESAPDVPQTFRIDGTRIDSIADLYAQLNDLLMRDDDWDLGPSLDALNDVLYRFDPRTGHAPAVFVWENHAHSRERLGVAATLEWLESKLARPETFNAETIIAQRDALLEGHGQTYFDLVCEIFADHPYVRLELV